MTERKAKAAGWPVSKQQISPLRRRMHAVSGRDDRRKLSVVSCGPRCALSSVYKQQIPCGNDRKKSKSGGLASWGSASWRSANSRSLHSGGACTPPPVEMTGGSCQLSVAVSAARYLPFTNSRFPAGMTERKAKAASQQVGGLAQVSELAQVRRRRRKALGGGS
jgi:hypothetical protein